MEFAINKFYIDFEKKLFLLLSSALAIMCMVVCLQYFVFMAHIQKMNLVKQEYYHHLEMLKKIIQDKNCDMVADDSDVDVDADADKTEDDASGRVQAPLDAFIDFVAPPLSEEEILDEQDEDKQKFQFVSLEDEKQLKDLRKQTRAQAVIRKKSKQHVAKNNLGAKQIAQLKKSYTDQVDHDFTFHWPLELHHFWLSSLFGARKKANGKPGFHYGIDLAAMKGTTIKAAAAGTVIQAQYVPGYGNNILIQHNKYYRTRYAHLHRITVNVGDKVAQGQKIGTVGDSGTVRKSGRDASHLHFEIYHNGSHVNPLRYLFN